MSLPPNLDDKIRKALTLLLAEDDDALRDTLLHFFSSEGFQVYAAGTGREAIDIRPGAKAQTFAPGLLFGGAVKLARLLFGPARGIFKLAKYVVRDAGEMR